jgi:predicted nucleic acid-binding protein
LILVDTNVLIDVLANDPDWRSWSAQSLQSGSARGSLLITDVVYAELSSRFATVQQFDLAIAGLEVALSRMPKRALFVAGQTFQRYRRGGGPRLSILADFFVGAHAQVEGLPILTRDTRRYRTYFPDVELIAPEP